MASCIDQMRDARITLYELDPAGVSSSSETMDANGFVIPGNPFENQVDFDSMVKATGEMALHGQNDVDRQIVQAVRNGENFYTFPIVPALRRRAILKTSVRSRFRWKARV